jgi:ABC-2 type transport system ATP-binding protein
MLQAEDLQRTLTALLEWAKSRDLVLGALDARSTSLEQAFLAVAASAGEPVNYNDNAKDVAA